MPTPTPTLYQREIAAAVARDALARRGGVFTAELPLGAGVRELAAQLEMLLMSVDVNAGGALLRVSSSEASAVKDRLVDHFRSGALDGLWRSSPEDVWLGRARVHYASHKQLADIRGAFSLIQVVDAHLLDSDGMERAQRLAAASNATVVFYGRPWNGATPFEQLKVANKRSTAPGGGPLHFRVSLDRAEDELPGYSDRVAQARAQLGHDHPEYAAAYELRPIASEQALSPKQLHALFGGGRARKAALGAPLAASVVITRLPASGPDPLRPAAATAVITVGEQAPDGLRVIDHRWAQAADAGSLARSIARFTSHVWRCGRVVVRSTAKSDARQAKRLLHDHLGARRVIWLDDLSVSRNAVVSGFLAAALTGRVSLYATDGSPEHRTLRRETEGALLRPRPPARRRGRRGRISRRAHAPRPLRRRTWSGACSAGACCARLVARRRPGAAGKRRQSGTQSRQSTQEGEMNRYTKTRRRRNEPILDGLPEQQSYADTGCEVSGACLSCPLPQCKFDDPAWYREFRRQTRDLEYFLAQKLEGLSVFEIARRCRVSPRTVHRGIRRVQDTPLAAQVA